MTVPVLGASQFWILDPLYTALGYVLSWFYAVIADYGVAIILLTIAVRLVTFPLTAKQAKAQQQLQKIQPELKRLQQKYKHDKQKLNEEMMKFYKENHVNPLGSCLPLLLQMPVLIVLYRLIIGLTASVILGFSVLPSPLPPPPPGATVATPENQAKITSGKLTAGVVSSGTLEGAQYMVGGQVTGTLANTDVKAGGKIPAAQVLNGKTPVTTLTNLTVQGGKVVGTPKHVPKDSKLYDALRASGGTMDSFGMDLAKSAASTKGADIIPYLVLVAGVMATGYYQQRQLTARAPKGAPANPQMQSLGKVFPVIFGVISFSIPAGVVVYFLVSNIWQIGQQAFIFRNQDARDPKAIAKSGAKAGGGGGGGGGKADGDGSGRGKGDAKGDGKAPAGEGKKSAKKATGSKDGRRPQAQSSGGRNSRQRSGQNRSRGRRPPPPRGTRPKG